MSSSTPTPVQNTAGNATRIGQWQTVVWDDPINLMSYVTRVFCQHFGYSQQRSHALMMEVHELGRAVVSTGAKEHMEADVMAMHSYGLNSTLEQAD